MYPSMHFLPILSYYILKYQQNFVFTFVAQQYIDFIWVIFYVAKIGANCTFYYHGVHKATIAIDLVIVDIPKGLLVLEFQFFLLHFFLYYVHFAYNIFMTMVLCWYSILKMQSGQKIHHLIFFNYNFKVGHEPWICKNSLRLDTPRNPNKIVSLLVCYFTFVLNHAFFVCLFDL